MAILGIGLEGYQEEVAAPTKQPKKTNLLFFLLVLGLAIIKDLIDLAAMGLDALGVALIATALGAIVGIPLIAISWLVSFLVGLFVNFTIAAYFFHRGEGLSRRLAIQSIGFIIELVPFVSLLPLTTLTFVIAHLVGHVQNPLQKAMQFARVLK